MSVAGAALPSSAVLAGLREVLEAAGYTEAGIEAASGNEPLAAIPVLLPRRVEPGSPLATLIKLFWLGLPVSSGEAARALEPAALGELGALVEADGGEVTARVRLTPWQGLLLAHDPEDAVAVGAEYVAGLHAAARTLASLTVRSPVGSAFDLGTGCGVQALLAARHAERVLATDINPRALWLTELNARLNALANVELREGSLFDPVAGEQFDLAVANPPFVVSPDSAFLFRDSGRPGDEISRDVVAGLARSLAEGAFATVLCNWIVDDRNDPFRPLEAWLEGSGCDVWLLHHRTDDPARYAALWNEQLRARDPRAYSEALARWLDYYEREGIAAIGSGAVIMRRRSDGRTWMKKDAMPFAPTGLASDHILRVFAAQDRLAALASEQALLDEVFALVDEHRLDQTLLYRDGEYVAQAAALALDEGVGVRGTVDPHAIHVLFALDGRRPLRELIADAAEATELDRDQLAEQTLATAQRLFALGFLVTNAGS